MMLRHCTVVYAALCALVCPCRPMPNAYAQDSPTINITRSHVSIAGCSQPRCLVYAELLVSEVQRRSGIRWEITTQGTTYSTTIKLGVKGSVSQRRQRTRPGLPSPDDEGYTINIKSGSIELVGGGEQGLLFAVGRFLRLINATHFQGYEIAPSSSVSVATMADVLSSSPDSKMRGHQLGYRPKTNSYDGWSVADYEQYVIDLALFGTNLIELIPWKTDDVMYSPMFQTTPQSMLANVSAIVDKYGLMCGLWYPMMEKDYTDTDTLTRARLEWAQVFKLTKRLDHVQIPAGDPGSRDPQALLAVAELFNTDYKAAFPNGTLWIGPQEWSPTQMLEWDQRVVAASTWLDGLVYGPHTASSLAMFLKTPSSTKFPIRLYPDITHSLTTQYGVPDWDRSLAITESRETINPRPTQFGWIAQQHLRLVIGVGFSSYSEGCHDDVNKYIWSSAAWGFDDKTRQANSTALAIETVSDYARVFFGSHIADNVTAVVFGLEQAWTGRLATNDAISLTLDRVKGIELASYSQDAFNWRLQQLRYRAYFDAFIQLRAARETKHEMRALDLIRTSDPQQGAEAIMTQATSALIGNDTSLQGNPIYLEELALKAQVIALAGELFHSIKMQLSVMRFFAEYTVRGANLDTLELPLNNAPYLLAQFDTIRAMPVSQQWASLQQLAHWSDVGEGGFYDDLGDVDNQPHLVIPTTWFEDPDSYINPLNARAIAKDVHWSKRFETPAAALPTTPVSWQTTVNTFYNAPLTLRYSNVTKGGNYSVSVVYAAINVYLNHFNSNDQLGSGAGSTPTLETRLEANGVEVHPLLAPPSVQHRLTFAIPVQALANNSTLELVWYMPDNAGGSGTGNYVAEVILTPHRARA